MPPKRKASTSPSSDGKKSKANETDTPAGTTTRARSPARSKSPARRPVTRSRAVSPIRSAGVSPKREGLKRMSTMDETTQEAIAFLQTSSGGKELLASSATVPETRGRAQARKALSEMMGDTPIIIEDEFDEKYEREKLHAVFQLFDTSREGAVGEEGIAELMRTMAKRPLKSKIRELIKGIKPEQKGRVTEDEFVDYIINKRREKAKRTKKIPKKLSSPVRKTRTPSPKRSAASSKSPPRKTSPKKATTSKSPPRKAASPKKAATAKSSPSPPRKASPKKAKSSGVRAAGARRTDSNDNGNVDSGVASPQRPAPVTYNILDFFNNGNDLPLGRDDAFSQFSLAVYTGMHPNIVNTWIERILQSKGINVQFYTSIRQFVNRLPVVDEAWIFSSSSDASKHPDNFQNWSETSEDEFVAAVKIFHESGRGLGIFASAAPYTVEANSVLSNLFGITLIDKVKGGETIKLDRNATTHLVCRGIRSLYEGIGQSRPETADSLNTHSFVPLVTSTAGHPTVFVREHETKWPPKGRVLVDTGCSKFLQTGDMSIVTYFANAAIWLLSVDLRVRKNAPITGSFVDDKTEYIWQYLHGGWYNYDPAASAIVEAAYRDYLDNPGKNDVRSIHSGHWNYMVDFLNMKQTNIQHKDHTVRSIRRVPKSQGIS